MPKEQGRKLIASNRRARHDFHLEDTYEAGLVLVGTEVKSLRQGRASLVDGFAEVDGGEVWLLNVHISPYSHRGYVGHEERRQRKLLLHKDEIRKLTGKVVERGLTLVPLRMYYKGGRVKVALALVKGKQLHDKRETIRRRDVDRETRAAVKERQRR